MTTFREEPPEFKIRDGVVITEWPGGDREAMTIKQFRMFVGRATDALNDHDHHKADVIPLFKPKKPATRRKTNRPQ